MNDALYWKCFFLILVFKSVNVSATTDKISFTIINSKTKTSTAVDEDM